MDRSKWSWRSWLPFFNDDGLKVASDEDKDVQCTSEDESSPW